MADHLVVAALEEEVAALRRRHRDVEVLVTGPGKVLAASGLARRLAGAPVRAVWVLGTAGGLEPGIGGVFEVATVEQHDFDSASLEGLVGRRYGVSLATAAARGVRLATGDVFVTDPGAVRSLRERGCALVDMEGYAYVAAATAAGVPIRIAKAVSDAADAGAAGSWSANVSRCAELLADWYEAQF